MAEQKETNSKKVLVIEDDTFLVKAYQIKFQKEGFGVEVAADGEEAMSMLEKAPPNIVLLDLMLPKVSGFDVLSSIRSRPQWKNVPVVILSNLGGGQDIDKGMKLGATDYIVKANAKIDEVVQKVKKFVK